MKELIKENTVLKARNLNLCVSCEICVLICPKKAISMKNSLGQFLPVIDRNKCILCGKCLDLCPGLDIYPKKLRLSKSIKNTLMGNYLGCYIAESKNPLIRKRSTSGGLITNLVVKLIEDKVYDATFILNFEKFEEKPVRLKPTNNVNEIINAAKSKYIPVSLYEIIKILRRKEQKRYIIIATPCLIYGIKKFVEEFNIPSDNLLFLGLFCSNTLNFNILKFYKEKYAKKNEKIEKFIFRTKERFGWPGHTKIIFDSGRSIILHRKIRMGLVKFFSLNRCLYCFDKLNFLSDISFGDCYIKNKTSIKGKSSIIVRTEKGKKIFDKYSYLFNWEKISIDDIFNSQKIERKFNNLAYAKIIIKKNTIYPEFEGETDFNSKLEKKLKKLEKYIRLGANYNNFKIQLKQWVERGIDKIKRISYKILIPFLLLFEGYIHRTKRIISPKYKNLKNILIFDGKFFNEGAQAMSLIASDQLKKIFPKKDIYHFSNNITDIEKSQSEKNKYKIKILPWTFDLKFIVLRSLYKYIFKDSKYINLKNDLLSVIRNASFIIDLSGFALSSQRGTYVCRSYLMNLIIAKKFSIPIYLLPQSFGPFIFSLKDRLYLFPLFKWYLEYPNKIFTREKEGLKYLRMFTNENVQKAYDIVLQHEISDLTKIFHKNIKFKEIKVEPGSVGLIPNINVINLTDREEIYLKYTLIIKYLINLKKTVYLLWHSHSDLSIWVELKERLPNNMYVKLISEDLNSIELENIIRQFDFLITSRYHALIQAYKNGVPSIVISWASKYYDLLKNFDQLDYYFDIRKDIDINIFYSKINQMLANIEKEKNIINQRLSNIKILKSPFMIFDNNS